MAEWINNGTDLANYIVDSEERIVRFSQLSKVTGLIPKRLIETFGEDFIEKVHWANLLLTIETEVFDSANTIMKLLLDKGRSRYYVFFFEKQPRVFLVNWYTGSILEKTEIRNNKIRISGKWHHIGHASSFSNGEG